MRARTLRWILIFAATLALASTVSAQATGGSFGGGDFGGGGSDFGGGSSDFGGGSSDFGGGGGGFSSAAAHPVRTLFMIFIGLAIAGVRFYVRQQRRSGSLGHGARGWSQVDISALQLAIDWRARRELQSKLEQLAKSGQTSSRNGLATLLRETVVSLRRAELSWLYAAVANYHPMSAASAEGIFRQLGVDARSRFRRELVRNADGHRSEQDAGQMQARSEEGEGVVVVTLIVAARREIVDVLQADDASRIRGLLDNVIGVANPQLLVAMEVVWSPAAENDRMSTAELESLYPHLKKLDERSIAGRVFCEYCRGPFAAELLKCTHCGAPGPGARAHG